MNSFTHIIFSRTALLRAHQRYVIDQLFSAKLEEGKGEIKRRTLFWASKDCMIADIQLTTYAYQETPKSIMTMANICSCGVLALISPYPTVASVESAQYMLATY